MLALISGMSRLDLFIHLQLLTRSQACVRGQAWQQEGSWNTGASPWSDLNSVTSVGVGRQWNERKSLIILA